jgi:hypothetical protein
MTKQGCCEGDSATNNPVCIKSVTPRNTKYIHFSALTDGEKQAFADFQFKELNRHLEDVMNIKADLKIIKEKHGIEPRRVYVNKWLEVDK